MNKDSKTLLKLYHLLVRPKLEYCVQAWRPYLRKDIDLLEKVTEEQLRSSSELLFWQEFIILWHIKEVWFNYCRDKKITRWFNWSI